MRALLDTHVWLWHLLDDKRLSAANAEIVADPANDIFLSPVSIWETHLLLERGRLRVQVTPAEWIRTSLRMLPVREAPLTFRIAIRARTLEGQHQDPADRFIAATAIEMKLPLLTCDQRLRDCTELRCL